MRSATRDRLQRRARGARGPLARPTRAHGLELLGHLAANGERDALREVGGERARGPGLALEARRDLDVEVLLRELAEERDAFRLEAARDLVDERNGGVAHATRLGVVAVAAGHVAGTVAPVEVRVRALGDADRGNLATWQPGNRWQPTGNHWLPVTTCTYWQPLATAGNRWQPLATAGNRWQPLATAGW